MREANSGKATGALMRLIRRKISGADMDKMASVRIRGTEEASVKGSEPTSIHASRGSYSSREREQSGDTNPSSGWLGIVFLLLGAGYLVKAGSYKIGTLGNAGPGLFPVFVGVVLVAGALGMVVEVGLVQARRKGEKKRQEIQVESASRGAGKLERREYAKLVMSAVLLIGCVFVLQRLGFVTTAAMLSAGTMLFIGERRWYVIGLTSLGLAVGAFFLFRIVLQIQLPTGLL